MDRGKALLADQIVTFKTQLKQEESYRYTANQIGKSIMIPVAYLAARLMYRGRSKKTGRSPTASPEFNRVIFRTIRIFRDKRVTASTSASKYEPGVGFRRVRQLLQ